MVLAISFNVLFPGPGTYNLRFLVDHELHYETSLGIAPLQGPFVF